MPESRLECIYSGGYSGMLVTSKPYVADGQNTWAYVRFRHHYPDRYWSIGGSSPLFAFRTNQSNPTVYMLHKTHGWVYARDAGYRTLGHAALGNPRGGQILQDTWVARNGYFDSKAEVALNC